MQTLYFRKFLKVQIMVRYAHFQTLPQVGGHAHESPKIFLKTLDDIKRKRGN